MTDSHPLVIRFGAFGDMVMLTPMLEQLHQRCGLPCDLVAIGGWNHDLFEQSPHVRNIYTIDSRSRAYWLNPAQRNLVRYLREHRHRFVWVCETNAKSYKLLARAGINRENSVTQLDQATIQGEHYCDKWIRLGNESPDGFDFAQNTPPSSPELFVSDAEGDECRRWLGALGLSADKPVLCIQAGSKRTTRRGAASRDSNTKYWPEQNWASVIDSIRKHEPEIQILLCGVPAEDEMCRAILSHCDSEDRVMSVAKDLPMRRLLALLSLAHSCISVDTGPAHAAAALDCPLVVLFGKADPARFRPVSAGSPVEILIGNQRGSGGEADIQRIEPATVVDRWLALHA